ncbi:hypothetical protein BDV96DRAFT_194736 [Lophiotrema nucula]|uniref:Uncharacterized protein n=1 Tax=Lophiotrema nucula TaxID=690887 RepID=A0A6A5YY21_9PLEO|nr:hypothetical protein BDV96DRAFT_194736 [Lophiotrema nucula]
MARAVDPYPKDIKTAPFPNVPSHTTFNYLIPPLQNTAVSAELAGSNNMTRNLSSDDGVPMRQLVVALRLAHLVDMLSRPMGMPEEDPTFAGRREIGQPFRITRPGATKRQPPPQTPPPSPPSPANVQREEEGNPFTSAAFLESEQARVSAQTATICEATQADQKKLEEGTQEENNDWVSGFRLRRTDSQL